MAIALMVGRDEKEKQLFHWFIESISRQLLKFDPRLDIRVWPDVGRVDEIDLALVWRHPLGMLKKFSSLKCIASLGAGVDHLMVDSELPRGIPVIRVKDPYMANDIVQYVLAYVLYHIKRVDHWNSFQQKHQWAKEPPFNFSDKTVGIMGLGFLGKKMAEALHFIGLRTIGWSYSRKDFPQITSFAGQDEFHSFLSQTDILVCILPLTLQTENILNRDTFSRLKQGGCLINLGRGEHLVDDDLIDALDSGHLSSACLDVFRKEPLPAEHPFWKHSKIRITPHIASVTHPETAIPQLMESWYKLGAGEKIENQVDMDKGY